MPPTKEQSLRFRIGVFVLASIILLAILITLFGGSGSLFRAQDTYTIIFEYAPGVGPGTPVRRSGVRIGEVQQVELDDKTGKVRVTIRIDRPHVLYQDDQPILVQGTLTGDTTMDGEKGVGSLFGVVKSEKESRPLFISRSPWCSNPG